MKFLPLISVMLAIAIAILVWAITYRPRVPAQPPLNLDWLRSEVERAEKRHGRVLELRKLFIMAKTEQINRELQNHARSS